MTFRLVQYDASEPHSWRSRHRDAIKEGETGWCITTRDDSEDRGADALRSRGLDPTLCYRFLVSGDRANPPTPFGGKNVWVYLYEDGGSSEPVFDMNVGFFARWFLSYESYEAG